MPPEFDEAIPLPGGAAGHDPTSRLDRSLFEASLDPLVTFGLDGAITDANEAMINVTGASRERLIGTDFADWFTAPAQARATWKLVFSDGSITGARLAIRHENGGVTDLIYNASVYKDPRGNILGGFAIAREVTESRAAEQQCVSFIESAPDAMLLASEDGTILLVNKQTERLFGYRRDELLGQAIEILVPAKFRGAHLGRRSKFFQEPLPRPMGGGLDLWGARKDGSEFPVEISLSPIESPRGLTVGATIRDVTMRKRAEAELVEQRAKELERLAELERFQKLTVDRELKMIELKREIAELRKRLRPGGAA